MRISEKVKTLVFAGVLAIAGVGMAVLPNGSAYAAEQDCKGANGRSVGKFDPEKGQSCEVDDQGKATIKTGGSGGSVKSSTWNQINKGIKESGTGGSDNVELKTIAQNIVNGLLYIIGILAVVMIIFGGIMYTTSAGDQAKVTKAKNIILYGLIGLIVAVLAYAIINFVLKDIIGVK